MIQLPNTQPVEHKNYREDGNLDVVKIWNTIQGEGPYAGIPSVFVRLAGCDLQCPMCDTDYTTDRRVLTLQSIVDTVRWYAKQGTFRLVVVTGGEPFRQNITPLVRALAFDKFKVQIETNGTIYDMNFPWSNPNVCVVCSPKTPKVAPQMADKAHYWKYVLRAGEVNLVDGLPDSALGNKEPPFRPMNLEELAHNGKVFLQPCDEHNASEASELGGTINIINRNRANISQTVASCMKFGYRLSCQVHKTLGLE